MTEEVLNLRGEVIGRLCELLVLASDVIRQQNTVIELLGGSPHESSDLLREIDSLVG